MPLDKLIIYLKYSDFKNELTSSASGSVGWLAASIINLAVMSFAFSLHIAKFDQ